MSEIIFNYFILGSQECRERETLPSSFGV